jgi:hypothetical protein
MRIEGFARKRAWLAAIGSGGIVLGHWLAYLFTIPADAERHHVLEATGHAYWPYVLALAVGAAAAGLAHFIYGCFSSSGSSSCDVKASFVPIALRLASVQVAGFLALEIGERLMSRAGLGEIFSDRSVVAGVIIQLIVAAIATIVLILLDRAVRALRRPTTPPRTGRTLNVAHLLSFYVAAPDVSAGAGGLRGPPA